MKKTGQCPKCGSRSLYHVAEARIPNYEYTNTVEPLTLTAHYGDSGEKGFFGMTKHVRTTVRLEAYVCAECAYTEFYSLNLARLEKFSKLEGTGVAKVDDEPEE